MKRAAIGSQAPRKLLPLPIGNSDWAHVAAHDWHADKTQLISGLLDCDATVALFTRPRRFGKTFALRMLKTFFENAEKDNTRLFKNTKVWQNPRCRKEQGKYPVIHITLKDAKGGDWRNVRALVESAVAAEFRRHVAVFADKECLPEWQSASSAIRQGRSTDAQLNLSLGTLAEALHVHYGEKPVILIDEYDSPINYAATHGFGEEALQFFRNFLSAALKDGEHCRLGVMTGILRVAKEGVLSGLNNPKVYSVFDDAFSDCFGFTEDEVRGMLEYYGHPEKMEEAKAWYDGYRFGRHGIYNPWSLLNYVADGFKPQPYWTSTSSNDLVTDALKRMTPAMRDALADFFEKRKSMVPCSKELGRYGTIQNNPDIKWSLLVHTGYLKVLSGPDPKGRHELAFPNLELQRVFCDDILEPIQRSPDANGVYQRILDALVDDDPDLFRRSLEKFLLVSASCFDMAHEDFFHGLLLGLLASMGDEYEIKSNREEGDGRPDILMRPRPGRTLPGVILELKSPTLPKRASQKRIDAALNAAAQEARRQIDKRRYAAEMEADGIAVLKYGIGFSGKHVALASVVARRGSPGRKASPILKARRKKSRK